jgi:hypothetical protein
MQAQRFVHSLLLASAAVVGLASSAYAGSFTLNDVYYGATDSYNNPPADVIGDSTFYITSAVVNRSGPNNDTLNIIINTNFAGAPGTNAADGTGYGSLFLNPLQWSAKDGSPPNHYAGDSFVNGNQNWAYAVTTPSTSGLTGLYATGLPFSGSATPDIISTTNFNGVPQYYTTADGQIVMSNVNGNPLSAPASGNPGYYFRQGQAVLFNPTDSTVAGTSATFTVGSGFLEYSIVDNGLLGNTFALAWDMTCANDVIQGLVTLPSTALNGTPLPAALPLFAGGLGVMGLLAGRRKRKNATAVAAT